MPKNLFQKNYAFMKTTFKIYCLPRSGSNYLKWLLENNYNIVLNQNEGGWKHGYVTNTTNNILIVKHPILWLPSIYNYLLTPTDLCPPIQPNFYKFLRNPINIQKETYGNPLIWWNESLKHYLSQIEIVIDYFKLKNNPEETLDQYFINYKNDIFKNQELVVLPSKEKTLLGDYKYQPTPHVWTDEDLDYIKFNISLNNLKFCY